MQKATKNWNYNNSRVDDFDQPLIYDYFRQNHYMPVKIKQKFLHLIMCCGGRSYIMSDDSQLQLIGLYLD